MRNNTLKRQAAAKGISVRRLITGAIRQEGSIFRAAISLGVTPNSLQYWLRRNGYEVRRTPTLVKVEKVAVND